MAKVKAKLIELFGIDIRSLAIFRIGLALVILFDLFIRLQDLTAHYTDEGVLPRYALITHFLEPWTMSIHLMSGLWQIQLIFFVLAIVFAFTLLVGYYTRLSAFISWILLISVQSRLPMALQGGDIVIRVLLFWGLFLPLGACWSLDAKRSVKPAPANQIISGGTVGLLLQVCFIYWFAAILKIDDSWIKDGTAVWYSLSIEQYAKPLGTYLLQFPTLLKWMTFATVALEGFGPFFAFSPIWTGPLRFATVLAFIFFHLVGLHLTMELGPFPWICSVGWLAFVPSWFWDKFLEKQDALAEPWRASWFSNILATFFVVYIFLWNVNSLPREKPLFSENAAAIGLLFHIDQEWNMFSPFPLRDDGWFVIPAKLRDGTKVDLFTGKPITYKKPDRVATVYTNDRWRSYMMNLMLDEDNDTYKLHYARYLCNHWNQTHSYEKQVMKLKIVFMWKVNDVNSPTPVPVKTVLWYHNCFGEPPGESAS